jgi:transposase-like protein
MTQIGVLITHHLRGFGHDQEGSSMTEPGRSQGSTGGRRRKRFLSPSEKYEVWVGLLRGEYTTVQAADRVGVDRTTIMRVRQVAKQGALDALAASKPGVRTGGVDPELAEAKAEIARLSEALKEMGVRLMLAEGKGRWD